MPNIESLPKWAQNRIADLERDLAIADQSITVLTGDTPVDEAHVLLTTADTEMPFPAHTGVRFVMEPILPNRMPQTLDCVVQTDRQGFRSLRILGDRGITLQPLSNNGVQIRFQ